jgi:hypothetical protein
VPDEPVGEVVRGEPDRGEAVGDRDAEVGCAVGLPVDLLDAGAAVGVVEGVAADVLVAAVVVDEDVGLAVLGDRDLSLEETKIHP